MKVMIVAASLMLLAVGIACGPTPKQKAEIASSYVKFACGKAFKEKKDADLCAAGCSTRENVEQLYGRGRDDVNEEFLKKCVGYFDHTPAPVSSVQPVRRSLTCEEVDSHYHTSANGMCYKNEPLEVRIVR